MAASAAAEAAVADDGLSEGITRAHVKLIEYHGKAGYDGMANVPKNAIKDAILSRRTVDIASRIEDSSILSWKMHASLCKLPKFSPWLAPIGARGCKIFTPGGAPQKAPPKRTKLGFHCVI